jgi:tryptophan synthase alpha chain
MNNRIDRKFAELKSRRRKALSVFLTTGYPSLAATERLVLDLEQAGVDFFEIGFPFSDPMADGPTIQKSSEEALKNGVTWDSLLALARNIRRRSQVPLVFMSYANTLYCRGWKKSAKALAEAGFDGAIIPDLIPEESGALHSAFRAEGLHLIHLLAPTSTPDRIQSVVRSSTGFIYCVSVTGVTGARAKLPVDEIRKFLKQVRRKTRVSSAQRPSAPAGADTFTDVMVKIESPIG